MIVASAPGRAGIIGNPSDMYGGSVISCSTAERAYVSIEPAERLILESDQGQIEIQRRSDLRLAGDHFDILRAVIAHQRLFELKAHLRCWSEVPFAAGLSSSTALLAAALRAVQEFLGICHNPYHFAELARAIELNQMDCVCGYQDQYMATFGGLNFLDFRDKEFYREVFSEPYATVEPLHERGVELPPLILAHTGVQRSSGAVHKPIRERWLEGDREVVDAYIAVAKLAREGKKAMLLKDWSQLGTLMNENHDIQRQLGGSGPENERLIAVALRHGAWGAKLAGAGQGGTIIAIHPQPGALIAPLTAAGAHRIIVPQSQPGVRCEPASTVAWPDRTRQLHPATTGRAAGVDAAKRAEPAASRSLKVAG